MAPSQEVNDGNLGKSFFIFYTIMGRKQWHCHVAFCVITLQKSK